MEVSCSIKEIALKDLTRTFYDQLRHFLGSSLPLSCESLSSRARTLCTLHPALHLSCSSQPHIGRAEGEVASWLMDYTCLLPFLHPQRMDCKGRLEMPPTSHLALAKISVGNPALGNPALAKTSVGVPSSKHKDTTPMFQSLVSSFCLQPALSFKCPSSLISHSAESQHWILYHSQWIDHCTREPSLDSASYDQDKIKVESVKKETRLIWADSTQQRLPYAQAMLENIASLRAYLTEGSFKSTLSGLMQLPATNLLPDVKYEGCSALEWLQAIRETVAEKKAVSL